MAGRPRRLITIIIIILLSIVPEKGTIGAHKKRSGITDVTYMVVAPLMATILAIRYPPTAKTVF